MKELLKLYNKIKEKNPQVLLSGSVALTLQKIKIRNEPMDLDIYIPSGQRIETINGMTEITSIEDEDYGEDDYIIRKFNLDYYDEDGSLCTVKVDFFKPKAAVTKKLQYLYVDEVKMIHCLDIMQFKLSHALDTASSKDKHIKDLIHILVNN